MSLGQLSLGHQILTLIVYALAVARVVRFVNHDKLLNFLYASIEYRIRDDARSDVERDRWAALSDFLICPFCVSIWVAAGSTWIVVWCPDNVVARYAGIVLAASYLVSLAAPLTAGDKREFGPA